MISAGSAPGIWLSRLAQAPLQPDRDTARRWAAAELGHREYQEAKPGLVARGLAWLLERLQELQAPHGPGPALGVGLVVVALGTLVVIAVRRSGGLHGDARARQAAEVFADTPMAAAAHRSGAQAHAEAGRWGSAIVERFRAVARELEERAILQPRPGRTAAEVARDAGAVLPELAPALALAARGFDDVRYGDAAGSQTGYEQVATLDDALRRARRPVPA